MRPLDQEDAEQMMRGLMIALAIALLAACSAEVSGPQVRLRPPSLEIGPNGGDSDFCPPGQAKKGRC